MATTSTRRRFIVAAAALALIPGAVHSSIIGLSGPKLQGYTFGGGGGGGGADVLSDPVTSALNATGSGTRYDVNSDADIDAVPWGTLGPGDVVNIFYNATPYTRKIGLRGQGTSTDRITIHGVTDGSGNRPKFDWSGATATPRTAAGCNPSGSYGGAHDVFSTGTELLGGFVVKRSPADTYGVYEAKFITFQNFELYGIASGGSFTKIDGSSGTFNDPGLIWLQIGQDVILQNNIIRDASGFGVFTMAKDGLLSEAVQRVQVLHNRIYNCGVSGQGSQHNLYIQSTNPIIRGNFIGRVRSGSNGSPYKSRSSGEIFEANWVEGSNRTTDFVHSEDQDIDGISTQTDNGIDLVKGNVLRNDYNLTGGGGANGGAFAGFHYGGDNLGEEDGSTVSDPDIDNPTYRDQCLFVHNTYVHRVTTAQFYRNCIFQPSLVATTIDAWNNIFELDGTSHHVWVRNAGNINLRGHNIIHGSNSPVIDTDADENGGTNATNPAKYEVSHLGTDHSGDPQFTDLANADYSLGASSSALGLATTPSGFTTYTNNVGTYSTVPAFQPRFRSNGLVVRPTASDLGALERGVG